MSFIRNFARIYVQFAVRHRIFIECPRFVSFDHGLAFRRDRSCMSVRSRSHARVKSSPRRSWFITERITVFNNFNFENLPSADANVTGTVRRVTIGFLIDQDTSGLGGRLGACSPRKVLIF